MGDKRLRAVSRTTGANAALKSGDIDIPGYQLDFAEVPVLVHAFRDMVRDLRYDVCEMALTTYLCAREHGVRFTAIPVFPVRGLHHGAIVRSSSRQLGLPDDLRGARVGVNRGYTVTTGVWARGILEREYAVDLDDITWVLSGDEHVESYEAPANVVAMPQDTTLADLVVEGELTAAIGVPVDRPELTTLLPDAEDAARRALVEDGLYPINHLIVVRDELLEERPDLGPLLFEAFGTAKQHHVRLLERGETAHASSADDLHHEIIEILGADPLPYGIEPNREMLELLLDHATRQGILRERPRLDELFAPGTLGLVA